MQNPRLHFDQGMQQLRPGDSSMKIIQRWSLPALLFLSLRFANGQNGNVVPTIENDVLRISVSISDASLTVVDKRIALEWRQQVRRGFRIAPDSIRMSPTSLSASVLGGGATYVLTISLTKESPYAFDLLLDMLDRHYAAMPAYPFPFVAPRKRLALRAEHEWRRDPHAPGKGGRN